MTIVAAVVILRSELHHLEPLMTEKMAVSFAPLRFSDAVD